MTQKVRVDLVCTYHDEEGEEVEATRTIRFNIDGSGRLEVDVCEECEKFLSEPLDYLLRYGVPAAELDTLRKHTCPRCNRPAPTRSALYSHAKRVHNTTLSKLEAEARGKTTAFDREDGEVPCPECSRTFHTDQGVVMHRVRKHNYRKS